MKHHFLLPLCSLALIFNGCGQSDEPLPPTTDTTVCENNSDCNPGFICQDNICVIPAICGDNLLVSGEECDDGNTESWDGCSAECKLEERQQITLMNWNILFGNYQLPGAVYLDGSTLYYTRDFAPASGAAPTPPRAEAMGRALATLPTLPAIITVMEMDPSWKAEENFAHLRQLGYRMIYPNTPFMLTQVIYQEERFTLLKKGFINLTSLWSGAGPAMKTCVTYGVFQEKATGEIFIALSTHWDPNDGVSTKNGFGGALDTLYLNEWDRIIEARESIQLVNRLRQEYPTAHIFYGGDLNTVDFEILFNAIEEILGGLDASDITLDLLFTMFNAQYHPGENFNGSVAVFTEESGLLAGRRYALDNELAINDHASVDCAEEIKGVLNMELKTPIILDYNFFSPEMVLKSYEVLDEGDFAVVSDHRPVKLELEYFPRHQALLTPLAYPDDSGTDWYTPIPEYQGGVFTADAYSDLL